MSAETLSKQYWLNLGLLGFLLIWPMMLTSRFKTDSCTGVRLCLAVMTTRITPVNHQRCSSQAYTRSHFIR